MKKIVKWVLAAGVALAFVGCASTKGTLYGVEQNKENGLAGWAREGVQFFTDEVEAYEAIKLSQKGLYAAGMSTALGNAKITAQAANLAARTALAGYIAQSITDLVHYENDVEKQDFKQNTQSNIANVLTGVRIVDGVQDTKTGSYYSLAFISDKDLKTTLGRVNSDQLRSLSEQLLEDWSIHWN